MRKHGAILAVLALAVVTLPALAWAAPGDPLWSDTQAGDADDQDAAVDVAVSADGATVVAAGWIERTGHGKDFLTVAYDPVTGDVLWSRTYDGRRHKQDSASGVAIVGSKVVVSGTSQGSRRAGDDIATVAYDLTTGARLWVHRYDSPEHGEESGSGVDAGGGRAYAIGQAGGRLAVVAISLKTGKTSWTYRTRRSGQALDVLVAGRRAYVTGESNRAGYSDALIGAFHRSGSRPWSGWFASVDPQTHDYGKHLALNADRSKLYLAANAGDFMALVSLDPASGAQDWAEFPIPQAGGQDRVSAVAVAPDGQSIFLTGQSEDLSSDPTFLTVAYDADGNELWTAWEDDANDEGGALDIGVSPDGSEVYVTGYGRDTTPAVQGPLTIAYDAATGEPSVWEHLSSATTFSGANALAVDPVTGAVIVAGELDLDFFIEAYEV